MNVHLVSGFLGSGKTTAIGTACKALLRKGCKAGVITNDQGIRLVDAGYFEGLSIPNRQVTGSCFCCNYNALDANIQSLIERNKPDVIFAESVGSCTDIVATVMKPLQQYCNDIQVTISTFADAILLKMLYLDGKKLFEEEVKYIYQKQLEEAGIIVVTKMDLIIANEASSIQSFLQAQYPEKPIVFVNGINIDSVYNWLNTLQQQSETTAPSSLQINYDTYGAGEAKLAWLDAELEIDNNNGNATDDAASLANAIHQKVQDHQLPIGHLKFLIDDVHKISYTATPETHSPLKSKTATSSKLLINARVQTTPAFLKTLMAAAVQEVKDARNCRIVVRSLSAFQPGYPMPTHRIAD